MIEPFASACPKGVVSYGLSSYGYDMRVADEFKVFTNVFSTVVDPKGFPEDSFVDLKGPHASFPRILLLWPEVSSTSGFPAMSCASSSARVPTLAQGSS